MPIVGVMGSGSHDHEAWAAPVGRMLAQRPVHLLTGGGRGVMTTVAQAFAQTEGRRGLSIGVLPAATAHGDPRVGYPNPWIEVPILTHLTALGTERESRNHINILTANVVIVLPGETGTTAEAHLCVRYGKAAAIAYLPDRAMMPEIPDDLPSTADFDELTAFVDRYIQP